MTLARLPRQGARWRRCRPGCSGSMPVSRRSVLLRACSRPRVRDTPFSGCQNGVGVLIGRNFESTTGSGTVVHNLIDNYQKGGVVVDGQLATNAPASHAEVAFNEVDGIGPTAVIAQNGIQVS